MNYQICLDKSVATGWKVTSWQKKGSRLVNFWYFKFVPPYLDRTDLNNKLSVNTVYLYCSPVEPMFQSKLSSMLQVVVGLMITFDVESAWQMHIYIIYAALGSVDVAFCYPVLSICEAVTVGGHYPHVGT